MFNGSHTDFLLCDLSERPRNSREKKMGLLKKSKLKFCLFALITMTAAGLFAQATPGVSIGTVKSISGNAIVLTSDSGDTVNVTVQDNARLQRIAPGETSLKNASPL